jgi:hypothetical protein
MIISNFREGISDLHAEIIRIVLDSISFHQVHNTILNHIYTVLNCKRSCDNKKVGLAFLSPVRTRSHLLSAYVTAKTERINPISDPGRSYLPSCPVGGIRTCLAIRDRGKETPWRGCLVPREPEQGMPSPGNRGCRQV